MNFGFLSRFTHNKAVSGATGASVAEIYPLAIQCESFIRADIKATYTKILTDVIERTHGIPDKLIPTLWDNCVGSEAPEGLISLLVDGMFLKSDVYIVYRKEVNVLRKATAEEQRKIKLDYEQKNSSDIGCYVSFRNFDLTDILRLYSLLEFCVTRGLYKSVNVSRAVQIKVAGMRSSVSLDDSELAIQQAQDIAMALARGDDVLVDSQDEITSAKPDTSGVEKAIEFLNMKRAFYLGFPMAYISGIQTGGIGSTGEGDNRAIERGLKAFFYSIIHPTLKALFGIETTFKSTDFREIESALEVLKTFELVSDTTLSREAKDEIIAVMFDLDAKAEKKAKEREASERGSDTTLNSAQLTAMSQFLAQLATGQLAPETAIAALMTSFSLSQDDAEAIVEPMVGFRPRIENA